MDTFYISHGSPTLSIDDSLPARHFLKSWVPTGLAGPQPPSAILVVSGHWETDTPAVNVIRDVQANVAMPLPCAQLAYPAPGAPDVAERTKQLLEDAGFGPVAEDRRRGLDHGAWVPLMVMYPEAGVPVFQLWVQTARDGAYHYDHGRALAPLREEGVLVVGSGSATHNMRRILRTLAPTSHEPAPWWAAEFDDWLRESLLGGRHDDVYLEVAPHAEVAHPQPDHFYPLHVALGAAGDGCKAELIHHSWSNATLSYASYRFTTKN
uniref:Extradiol ring-cleavage dioxygenase class III enzyme subunit B domain-containing protein n=1 Tax=Setaria italica TaxID=4555 RepID=K3XRS1_SETIT